MKPDTMTVRPGGKTLGEETPKILRENPDASIGNLKSYKSWAVLSASELQCQSVPLARYRIHRILRVTNQVHQDLQHLMPIAHALGNRIIPLIDLIPATLKC